MFTTYKTALAKLLAPLLNSSESAIFDQIVLAPENVE